MNVRAHLSMLFHLDKCLGCHTCSIACKSLWTDPRGSEYMWWNNVEARPGTGYPTLWEDQEHFRGGWALKENGELKLRLQSRLGGLARLFYNPSLPTLDDYYEPFTFRYQDLIDAPEGNDQPVAVPVSLITGEPIAIESGPNWDDDLAGSSLYARNDPNLEGVPERVRAQLEGVERVVLSYLPRTCNHCLNPACAAACPSGAIYKRAEDGVVLVNEQRCRGWRLCVAACPYKKTFNNWATGKSEKCILCFPRLESGQATGCAHSCPGRIRYIGVLLYDADRIPTAAQVPDAEILASQLGAILDPRDPEVLREAERSGVDPGWLRAAQASPVYRFVKEWGLAFPLHPEYRTMTMMFYVPPLSPALNVEGEGGVDFLGGDGSDPLDAVESARLPVRYLANLFTAGVEEPMWRALRKLQAMRLYQRERSIQGAASEAALSALRAAGLTPEQADAAHALSTTAPFAERFVLPAYHREVWDGRGPDSEERRATVGMGYARSPAREN
ncbi:MAG: nitrate reductase subunit beta [Deltaproteobacteria bacterium]|nr:nitrate reductase subunit beta [Deltaproteobacteria bacterium]